MATGGSVTEYNLSESSLPSKDEIKINSSVKKGCLPSCENGSTNNVENRCLNRKNNSSMSYDKSGATDDIPDRDVEEDGFLGNKKNSCDCTSNEKECFSEGVKDETKEILGNSPPMKTTTVDEDLNEADEDEIERKSNSEDEEENYESAEEHLTREEAEERVNECQDLKSKGNELFKKQEYIEAKDFYSRAIKRCPKENTGDKSVFYSNRAACYQKLEEYESAISDCSRALELAPNYLKARLRRAQCYEKVEKLEEALEDYKIVFENDRSCQSAREAIMRLPEEIKVKHEKLKEEMIGKLKDLGNMVLRPFGLSTDNFKLQQDPNSGGYSINFQK